MSATGLRMAGFRLPRRGGAPLHGGAVIAAAGVLALAGAGAVATMLAPEEAANAKVSAVGQSLPQVPPPAPEPLQFKAVSPTDAVAYNASIPLSGFPNPAARPFYLKAAGETAERSLECLTSAVYYEAATESEDGQRAVAQVVLNRLRHPAFPNSVCGVVFQGSERSTGCQFTFTCDGAIMRAPNRAYWERARRIAREALAGKVYKPVGWATHYHTNWVVPYWSASLTKLANVGSHIFYRWEGGWGTAPAFRDVHAGAEPVLPKMAYIGIGALPTEVPAEQQAMLAETELGVSDAAEAGLAGRKIVQRFEPVKREGVAETLAKQSGAKPVSESLRWALTGEAAPAAESAPGATVGVAASK